MTQRQEVRFKVFTETRTQTRGRDIFPLELIDFIKGDGTYDTTTYKYTVQNAGTYFLGFSCKRMFRNNSSAYQITLDRIVDGVSTTRVLNRGLLASGSDGTDTTTNSCFMYKLEVGDKLYILQWWGRSVTNFSTYTSDDTLNSFLGIGLIY